MTERNDALQAQIDALKQQLAQLTGRVPRPKEIPPEERADYIKQGSARHVAFLGLRKATPKEVAQSEKKEAANEIGLVYEGYVLEDITAFGVMVDRAVLKAILMQKVHQLAPMPTPQSDDPNAPNYAPPLWVPSDVGE